MVAIKGADAEDILIKAPQREGTRDNEGSGRRGYTDQGPVERNMAARKGADAEAILMKGPQREGTRDDKASGRRG